MQLSQPETVIRERAYAIWEAEGRPDGREWDHWVRAASEIQVKPAQPVAAATVKQPAGKKAGGKGKMRLSLRR